MRGLWRGLVRPRSPLSYAQRRLWFLERLEAGGGSGSGSPDGGGASSNPYVIPLALRLVGRLDRAALEGALCDLIERHESLRTVFRSISGCRGNRFLSPGGAAAACGCGGRGGQSRGGADGGGWTGLRSIVRAAAAGASVRARRRAACAACAAASHRRRRMVAVRWRWIWRRFTGRAARGWRAALAPLPVQYARLHAVAAGGARRRGRWRKRDGAAAVVLGRRRWRAAGADRAAGRPAAAGGGQPSRRAVALTIDAGLHRGLAALARGCGASLFMVLQAGWRGAVAAGGGLRHRHRQPDRRARRCRAGRTDRVLRQHPGAAHRHRRQPKLQGADRPGAGPATLPPMAMPICRSSGWSRCSIRRGRCRGTRCSR